MEFLCLVGGSVLDSAKFLVSNSSLINSLRGTKSSTHKNNVAETSCDKFTNKLWFHLVFEVVEKFERGKPHTYPSKNLSNSRKYSLESPTITINLFFVALFCKCALLHNVE
ncbi:hypothetical protein ACWIWK_06585 [Helicobacter sp. 23-1048]